LASSTAAATGLPLPNQLAGIAVVVDGMGFSTGATLIYASPTQVNFGDARGRAFGHDERAGGGSRNHHRERDGAGAGCGAGFLQCGWHGRRTGRCSYAMRPCRTATRSRSMWGWMRRFTWNCSARGLAAGRTIPSRWADRVFRFCMPQNQYPGLDQVNIPLVLGLRGAGTVNVALTVDGVASNPVRIAIQ